MRQISASLLFPVKKWRAEGSLALLARCQLGSMPNPGIDGPLRAEGIAHSRPGATALWGGCLEMGTPGAIRPDNVSSQRAEEKKQVLRLPASSSRRLSGRGLGVAEVPRVEVTSGRYGYGQPAREARRGSTLHSRQQHRTGPVRRLLPYLWVEGKRDPFPLFAMSPCSSTPHWDCSHVIAGAAAGSSAHVNIGIEPRKAGDRVGVALAFLLPQ
jgi:hypothetical protein